MNTKEPVLFTIRLPDIADYRMVETVTDCEIEYQNDCAWQIANEGTINAAEISESVQIALDAYCEQNMDLDWTKYCYALRKMFASDVLYAILKDKNYPSNTKERFFPEWRACEGWLYINIPETTKPFLHDWFIAALEDGSDVISELAMLFFVADSTIGGLPNKPEELAAYLEIETEPYPDCSKQNAQDLHYDYFIESIKQWLQENITSDLIEQCNSDKEKLAELWDALIEAAEEDEDD